MNPMPLKAGELAPDFSLPSTTGETVTRAQYRNKAGLALIFTTSTDAIKAMLADIERNLGAYQKLGAKVFVITRNAPPSAVALPTLLDAEGVAWARYSDQQTAGYGVFVLDRYGGVDSQIVTADPAELPDEDTIREWVQSAMYRCNI